MKRLFVAGLFFVLVFWTGSILAQDGDRIIRGGVLNGKAVNLVKPIYPPAAKTVKAAGIVSVQVTIDEKGNVISAEAVSGHPLLKEASEKAAKDSKFNPTLLSGVPVKVTGTVVYNFFSGDETVANTENNAPSIPGQINAGVVNGKAIKLPIPAYPPAAKAVKADGVVNVQVTIDENGDVISATAVSGHPLLRASAAEAAKNAKFSPTRLSGEPVKVTGVIVYNFSAATGEAASGEILNSRAQKLLNPEYPEEAKRAGAGGAVTVQVTINEEGNVISAEATSGDPLLREASEKAAKGSKFNPTVWAGKPVKVTGVIVYNFMPPKNNNYKIIDKD